MQKTIFITGASSGLGKETAKLFQEKGWDVIATMRNPKNGHSSLISGKIKKECSSMLLPLLGCWAGISFLLTKFVLAGALPSGLKNIVCL